MKSKFQAQFKSAETKGIPFAVILGEDEQKQGKVKIKELGLPKDHPEKDGVMVNTTTLVKEIRSRLQKKAETDTITSSMNGLDTQEPSEPPKRDGIAT